MAEPQAPGPREDAILKLMVEFRQLWLADEALRSDPSEPASLTPTKRIRLWVFIPLLAVAIASALLIGQLLEHSSDVSLHFPWVPRGQTATRPAAGGTVPPAPVLPPPDREVGASTPAPSTVPQGGPLPTADADASAPASSAPRPAQPLGYHVQAGAFNVREYADDLVRQLRARGYPAAIVDAPTGPPHRVWIGGILDRTDADRLVNRLQGDGFEAIVLPQ